MPLAYAEDARRINEELDQEINGPKTWKLTSMKRLQARHVMAQDSGDWNEVEQVKKSTIWKQSVRSAARKRKSSRKKEMKQYIACKESGPWRKRDPPSDDESCGKCARQAHWAASAASTS